ncbi:MAG TPA: alpha/beta hydrolase [Hyphomicrobium sp.]|nr:alpha/beta hydrolase [Hyphomicrobium sp.]
MTEQAMTFGPGGAMIGILTRPTTPRKNAPVVLLTNAGVIPRQGPHRINVKLARALALQGIASLRFDLSGNGDSGSIGNTEGICAQAVNDLQSAMDAVNNAMGTSRFLIVGICSGAVHAYNVALADERVSGILMFDGFWYRSRYTTPIRDVKRALDADWASRIAAIKRRFVPTNVAEEPTAESQAANSMAANNPYSSPPIEDYKAAMRKLFNRGTDVFVLFGGSVIDYYSYAGQFKDVFAGEPFYADVRCEFHPDIDHTFISRHAQQKLLALACDWASAQEKKSMALNQRV